MPPRVEPVAARIVLRGRVQGVGIRPVIARLAQNLQLNGFVRNAAGGVELHVQGDASNVDLFCRQIATQLPTGAALESIETQTAKSGHHAAFVIQNSAVIDSPIATCVPVDTAFCDVCFREVLARGNRRHGYPFTTCTDCGPRYSLIRSMPFDRSATTMRAFEMCPACRGEYDSASDRRFHAQTIACADCGPRVSFCDPASDTSSTDGKAIEDAANAVRSGRILALKGVGGYQLVCDATSTEAVERLRQRKQRPRKPLAVMLPSVDETERYAVMTGADRAALTDRGNPIVLVASLDDSALSPLIYPSLNCVGLMLPSTPLHLWLLKTVGVPCVVTSGNIDGEPLAFRDTPGRNQLSEVADVWLDHNREIVRPIDDSVVRCIIDRPVTIRAARGIAPLPLQIGTSEAILAVGGNQKVALALSNHHQSVLGPHIGDLNSVAARDRFVLHVEQFTQLYGVQPAVIAHDMHPDFFTTRWAGEQAARSVAVQHHHAHVAAGMIEHGWLDREVLGVAFDGTGFGTDGTIWGGEFLLCSASTFERIARLHPFVLPGGDQAVRQPWRIALALIQQATDVETAAKVLHWASPEPTFRQLSCLLSGSPASTVFPVTSSVGRLFDAVASLLLKITETSYEGEAAARLETICDASASGEYALPLTPGDVTEIDWRPMIRDILSEIRNGVSIGVIATRFTRGLARAVSQVCAGFPEYPVVLSGGCFQNELLTEETKRMLISHPHPVGLPGRIPPNDGGLAAGQLAVAAARLAQAQGASSLSQERFS